MNLPTPETIKQLARKWLKNKITDQEKKVYLDWYTSDVEDTHAWEGEDQSRPELEGRLLRDINARLDKEERKWSWRTFIRSAAILLLIGGATIMFILKENTTSVDTTALSTIKPGIKKATLTLSNGSTISLEDFQKGTIEDQTGSKISRDSTGKLLYEVAGTKSIANYTVSTPIGTEYQFRLPDGSEVWLNSGSSITFPSHFIAKQERRIQLKGEGYFEIKKDKTSPFKVVTQSQEITVVGTHFNVDSYAEESYTKTTLLEGSVIVKPILKNPIVLTPGQQLILSAKSAVVKEVDTTEAVGWKNGKFIFRQEDFKVALTRIAKWYNVSIIYQNIKPIEFKPWISISRQNSLSAVLSLLESTNEVHLKIEGRNIIVQN